MLPCDPRHHTPRAQDKRPTSVSDLSPLRIAFEGMDYAFMSTPLVEAYTQQRWCVRR